MWRLQMHTGLETVILKNQKMAKIAEKWPFLGGFSYILFNFGHFLSIIYSARIGMVLAVPLPQIKCPKYKDIPRPDARQGFTGESLGKMANFCQNWHILRSKFLKFRYLRPKRVNRCFICRGLISYSIQTSFPPFI